MDQQFVLPAGMSLDLSVEAVGPVEPVPDNYAFVINVSSLVDATSFSLAPGHELRRAKSEEASKIREILEYQTPGPNDEVKVAPWEHKRTGDVVEHLPEAEWRYHVIGFRGSNFTVEDLRHVLDLAPLELKIGFVVMYHVGPGESLHEARTLHPGRLFQLLEDADRARLAFLDVKASDVEEIKGIHTQFQQHDPHGDVKLLARQLHDVETLPSSSPLRFLGYFAILESLLTHPPKPSDPYDSITRQVKKKIALLDHRFLHHIDYSPFSCTNAETVWGKMYAYRSLLAHGGTPSFDGELNILGNHDNALKLVKQTVKATIRQSLSEPQLLVDLRDC